MEKISKLIKILAATAAAILLMAALLYIVWPMLVAVEREAFAEEIVFKARDGVQAVIVEADFSEPPYINSELSALPAAGASGENGELIIKGVLSIDKIELEQPVFEGFEREGLRFGLGFAELDGSSGAKGAMVIAGVCGLPEGDRFSRLDELAAGDIVTFTSSGESNTSLYEVIRTDRATADSLAGALTEEHYESWLALVSPASATARDDYLVVWCKYMGN